MEDLVSVVVPVYKVEAYLEACISSLLAQTHTNVEIILVDDGSPDQCGTICDAYARQDDRVRVIHKKNGGLSDARNAGMAVATAPYLTFVDSDDWADPRYVERLLEILVDTNADISVCGYERVAENGETIAPAISAHSEVLSWSPNQALREYLKNRIHTASWGKLYRRAGLPEWKFPFGRVHEDTYTTYRLLHSAGLVAQTDERLYFYRRREDSIVGGPFNTKHARDYIGAREAEIEFYDSEGLTEFRDLAAERLFWRYERVIEEMRNDPPPDYQAVLSGFHRLRQVLRGG